MHRVVNLFSFQHELFNQDFHGDIFSKLRRGAVAPAVLAVERYMTLWRNTTIEAITALLSLGAKRASALFSQIAFIAL